MDNEKLILLLQRHECLYNKYCPSYKLADKKKKSWQEISKIMEVPEKMCIRRWSCLRDRFAKEKRKENLPSGSGARLNPQWCLMPTMEFISSHIIPRATSRCSYNILDQNLNTATDLPESPVDTSMSHDSPETVEKNKSKRKRKNDKDNIDNCFMEAVDAFKTLCEKKEKQDDDDKDPVKGFGKMIMGMIAAMPPAKQLEVIKKVTVLVTEISLKPC